jgi:hypothetical protein
MFGFLCMVEGGRYDDDLEVVPCGTFVLSGIYLLVSGVLGSARFFGLGLVTFGCALAVLELAPPPSGNRVSGAAIVDVVLKAYIAGSCLVAASSPSSHPGPRSRRTGKHRSVADGRVSGRQRPGRRRRRIGVLTVRGFRSYDIDF